MIANITARPNASLFWKSPTLPRPKTHLILTSALCRLSFMKTLQEVAQQAMICVTEACPINNDLWNSTAVVV